MVLGDDVTDHANRFRELAADQARSGWYARNKDAMKGIQRHNSVLEQALRDPRMPARSFHFTHADLLARDVRSLFEFIGEPFDSSCANATLRRTHSF